MEPIRRVFLLNFYWAFFHLPSRSQGFPTNPVGHSVGCSSFRFNLFKPSFLGLGLGLGLLLILGGCSSDNSNASKVLEFTSTPSHINLVNQTIYDLSGTWHTGSSRNWSSHWRLSGVPSSL